MGEIKRCEHCGFPLYRKYGVLTCETRGCVGYNQGDGYDLPDAAVREIRESEGRCGSCGAFDGPTHQCPQYTATRFCSPFETTEVCAFCEVNKATHFSMDWDAALCDECEAGQERLLAAAKSGDLPAEWQAIIKEERDAQD